MTAKFLITGDRSMPALAAIAAVSGTLSLLTAKFPGLTEHDIITGDLEGGVERAVRYLVPQAQTFKYSHDAEGHVLFDDAYDLLSEDTEYAVVLHTEPLDSRIAKSVMKNFPASAVLLPLTEPVTLDA